MLLIVFVLQYRESEQVVIEDRVEKENLRRHLDREQTERNAAIKVNMQHLLEPPLNRQQLAISNFGLLACIYWVQSGEDVFMNLTECTQFGFPPEKNSIASSSNCNNSNNNISKNSR